MRGFGDRLLLWCICYAILAEQLQRQNTILLQGIEHDATSRRLGTKLLGVTQMVDLQLHMLFSLLWRINAIQMNTMVIERKGGRFVLYAVFFTKIPKSVYSRARVFRTILGSKGCAYTQEAVPRSCPRTAPLKFVLPAGKSARLVCELIHL